jgi:phage virion morphogenesis protein
VTWSAQIVGKDPLQALRRLRESIENMQPIMREIGDELVTSTKLRIDRSVSPDGTPFAPVIRGGKPLRDTGAHIYNTLHSVASSSAVVVGVPYGWAIVHQQGATIRAKNVPFLRFQIRGKGWFSKKQVTIPARPWLGVSRDDVTEILAIVQHATVGAAVRA